MSERGEVIMSNKPIRRIYSDEFKMDAVALIFEHEYSVPEAARHLEMSVKTLQKWKRRYEVENETPSVESAAKEEIISLHKENKQLRMEREILKKASVDSTSQHNTVIHYLFGSFKFQYLSWSIV